MNVGKNAAHILLLLFIVGHLGNKHEGFMWLLFSGILLPNGRMEREGG